MKKRILSIIIRAAVSGSLILILLYIMRGKYAQIWSAIKGASFFYLAAGFMAFFLASIVASVRLKMIINAQGTVSVNYREALSLTLIGYFFNNFLPTSIGGDFAKAFYLSKKSEKKIESYTAIFIDRMIGLLTMVLMAAVAILFAQSQIVDPGVRRLIYIITACSFLGVLFMVNKSFAKKFSWLLNMLKPVEDKLIRLYNAVHIYKHHTRLLINSLLISIVSQGLFFLSIGLLALSIGSAIPALDLLLRMPIVCVISLLPSINGLGVREGSTVVLFGPIMGKESAFILSILWFIMLLATSLIGGLIYAFSPQFRFKWGEIRQAEV